MNIIMRFYWKKKTNSQAALTFAASIFFRVAMATIAPTKLVNAISCRPDIKMKVPQLRSDRVPDTIKISITRSGGLDTPDRLKQSITKRTMLYMTC